MGNDTHSKGNVEHFLFVILDKAALPVVAIEDLENASVMTEIATVIKVITMDSRIDARLEKWFRRTVEGRAFSGCV